MSVAWIGSQPVPLADAVRTAAKLLASSRCPVFSLDADVHGTRSAIALAAVLGAAYDHRSGDAVAREVALFTDHGGMFTTPGEVRRRSSLIVLVGDIAPAHAELFKGWGGSSPDLGDKAPRRWFQVSASDRPTRRGKAVVKAVPLKGEGLSLNATLAVLRAELQDRMVAAPLQNVERLKKAMASAQFPVFVFSGGSLDQAGLVMLQDLIVDFNSRHRLSSLFLPDDDDAWGTVLTSLWMTGFPPRTGFINSLPSYDPVRWDVQRMIREREADVHVWMSARGGEDPPKRGSAAVIALDKTERPARGAAVTIAVGEAGLDHDGVRYSSRVGTFTAVRAAEPSPLPSVSAVLRQLAEAMPGKGTLIC
ncbi:tungsten formylmethanofuran dehydrogenase [Phyllobacterium sp. 21LDTY02-6]|uniref:tungsten formylmethanofuran dehydrogenase n=1 Tax=Phyllobacterium sp. 21LDTY02-6 TaxID=2944903 RepID=UPI002020539C|nr:tungsten formylmethanofuran dehydrogenase [Phyllobacterium sp. 21LDTY02-6]MCO4318211.1 tungsten formylmethanofuran dehydrogenase [Phyllobacterium sp. 21LDTY02-6]